jgi:hypothetical protein
MAMSLIHGATVTLHVKTQTGTDAFGAPVYTETAETVENVLIAQPSGDDITNELNLTGRRIDYILGIPKGDGHEWENVRVEFFGRMFQTFGAIEQGIEDNVPGPWHKKIRCMRAD